MEFEMYKEKKEKTQKVIFKSYIDGTDGCLMVDAVDEDGFLLSHILYITKGGKLNKCGCVDPEIGFKLDTNGKIEEGDDE